MFSFIVKYIISFHTFYRERNMFTLPSPTPWWEKYYILCIPHYYFLFWHCWGSINLFFLNRWIHKHNENDDCNRPQWCENLWFHWLPYPYHQNFQLLINTRTMLLKAYNYLLYLKAIFEWFWFYIRLLIILRVCKNHFKISLLVFEWQWLEC